MGIPYSKEVQVTPKIDVNKSLKNIEAICDIDYYKLKDNVLKDSFLVIVKNKYQDFRKIDDDRSDIYTKEDAILWHKITKDEAVNKTKFTNWYCSIADAEEKINEVNLQEEEITKFFYNGIIYDVCFFT